MVKMKRYPNNPIFGPERDCSWESRAVFNGCPVKDGDTYHFVYRALSRKQKHRGHEMNISRVGYARGKDGIFFEERRPLVLPELPWEAYGCEDPRVTFFEGKYYIFYTALSDYPHTPQGIKLGVAVTTDFKNIESKHQVTHFNSKAMAMFPERVNGKIAVILTVNTDLPPVRIALALFDTVEQMWSQDYWDKWYQDLDSHTIHLQRSLIDHIEVGTAPVKTESGWLMLFSYIRGYRSPHPVFGIEGALLDLANPLRVVGRTSSPVLTPWEVYEMFGDIPNVVFPSGALIEDGVLKLYYGAADSTCCLATCSVSELIRDMLPEQPKADLIPAPDEAARFERFEGNPVIEARFHHTWEAQCTFNPTAVALDGKVFILYRALDPYGVSSVGCAISSDGIHIDERLDEPVYVPRAHFELPQAVGYSGCEDARVSAMDGKLYMCYTAYSGIDPARVAFTSISQEDFLARRFDRWEMPLAISPEDKYDKNGCIVGERINGKYVFFHRLGRSIWIDYVDSLDELKHGRKLEGRVLMDPRDDRWDSEKIGIGGPPFKWNDTWILLYHGLSRSDGKYRLGAALLDLEAGGKILKRLDYPVLEPEADYEFSGLRPGTVFTCGAVVLEDVIYVYYGSADQTTSIGIMPLRALTEALQP